MSYTAPPPAAPAPEAPKKKPIYKRVWFIVLAVLVVIIVATQAGGGGDDSTATTSGAASTDDTAIAGEPETGAVAEPAVEESSNPGIGEEAADGKFTFVVNGIDCSATEIGDQYFGETAQGQFCIVDVTITNTGNEAQSFFGDNATLFNADKQQFSADTSAAIYLEDSSSLYEEINPGNTLNSRVVFDVPAGTVPTAIELHDSAFSGGVTIDLQ